MTAAIVATAAVVAAVIVATANSKRNVTGKTGPAYATAVIHDAMTTVICRTWLTHLTAALRTSEKRAGPAQARYQKISLPLPPTHSLTHCLTHSLPLFFTLSNSHPHSLTHSLTQTLAHALSHSPTSLTNLPTYLTFLPYLTYLTYLTCLTCRPADLPTYRPTHSLTD